jgi:hypothetical protein
VVVNLLLFFQVILFVLVSMSAFGKIMPDNDLHLEDDLYSLTANINEQEFHQIINEVTEKYSEIVSSHGARLSVRGSWEDSRVNAYAQQLGNKWNVYLYGGLARRPELTADGFTLVICHELGHHLGGFPFIGDKWSTSEGQSDYFATQACARRVWGKQYEKNAESRSVVKEIPKAKCDQVWSSQPERDLCYRMAMAGDSLAQLLSKLNDQTADFGTPDTSTVDSTYTGHPHGQCRLDTFFAGALCAESFDQTVIPGKNHSRKEIEAMKSSCMRVALHEQGVRPRCWFKPSLSSAVFVESVKVKEISGNKNGTVDPGEAASIAVQLRNLALRSYQNVVSKIEVAGNKIGVQKGEIPFRQLPSKSTTASDEVFEIKLDDVQCGEEFDFRIKSDQAVPHQMRVRAGRIVVVENKAVVDQEIPDNESRGLSSSLRIEAQENYPVLKVTTEIEHTNIGDLRVGLTAPWGQVFSLHDRTGGNANDIKKTFELHLPESAMINGEWSLKVSDHANYDVGRLNGWQVHFEKAVCD